MPVSGYPRPKFSRDWRVNLAGWFLVLSYGLGAPVFAVAEYRAQIMSVRFEYPAAFIYFICFTQVVCAIALLIRNLALSSLAVLSVISVGAAASHIRIGSSLTALPAVAYTVLQIWFAYRIRRSALRIPSD